MRGTIATSHRLMPNNQLQSALAEFKMAVQGKEAPVEF